MKYKLIPLLSCVLVIGLVSSCSNKDKTKPAQQLVDDSNVSNLIEKWSKAHSSKDIAVLSTLYGNSVLYYGTQRDKNECVENKLSFFKKYPDYYQQIIGEIDTEKISDVEFKCSFVKKSTVNGKSTDYPSYLVFTREQNNWRTTTEGDLITDKNLTKVKEPKIPTNAVKGDFNGDGKLDYMWLVRPKISGENECVGGCISYIKFSDSQMPSIKVENCIGGTPDNLGDLNNNGTDEIGILPDWFTSCWHSYNVYTLISHNWIFAVEPIITHCNQWEEGVKPIEVDYNRVGNVLIRHSDHTGDDIVTKTKSVPIVK